MPAAGSILVVCTGNICRSPYIERALAAGIAGSGVVVHSAGTGALVGHEMAPDAAVRLARAGGDPKEFVSRQLVPEMVQEADVILAATRKHRSAVVQMDPRALRRAFTVSDFSDLIADLSPTASTGDGSVMARLAAAAVSRRAQVQPRAPEDVDIVDPYGHPARVYEQMARHIDELLPPMISTIRAWAGAAQTTLNH